MKYLLVIGGLFLCGCTTWKWKHEPIIPKHKGGWIESYNYYVIDPNSDTPDAFFVNLSNWSCKYAESNILFFNVALI